MTEEFQKRQAEKPDQFTLAWWNSQYQALHKDYRGACHAIHLALADNEDLGKQLRELQGRLQALEAASELDRAKIGELQAVIAKQQERIDRHAEFLTQLKQKKESLNAK